MKTKNLTLPLAIILSSVVLVSGLFIIQYSKQTSIEKQQQLELNAKTEKENIDAEIQRQDYISKRKQFCFDVEQKERKNYPNVEGSQYIVSTDTCEVIYTTDEYKGVDCDKRFGDLKFKYYNLWELCHYGIYKRVF